MHWLRFGRNIFNDYQRNLGWHMTPDVQTHRIQGYAVNRVWQAGRHCPELDGVRGIAILMVTLYRFTKEIDPSEHSLLAIVHRFAPIGERGVDLFFVLSGFLITGILLESKPREGYFRNFFVRRALRIFPLYFATLLATLFVLPSFLGTSAFDLPRNEQVYLWTYMTNVRMSWLNTWCFGPLDHFWSLAVEEHFYFVWPLVVYFLSPRTLLRLCLGIIVVVGIGRIMAATRPELGLAVDVLTLFRCDSLCFGALLAVCLNRGVSPITIEKLAKWTLPLLLCIAIAIAIYGGRMLTLPSSLCPAIWALLMAVLLTRFRSHWMGRVTRNGILRWFGKYSYGMYVFQLPLVSVVTIGLFQASLPGFAYHPVFTSLLYIGAMLLLNCLLAFASFHCFEKHFLKLKHKWQTN